MAMGTPAMDFPPLITPGLPRANKKLAFGLVITASLPCALAGMPHVMGHSFGHLGGHKGYHP